MPLVKPMPVASKYLAQKWENEHFRTHQLRVLHASSHLDNSAPKQYPHLRLGLNKVALQEERQNKYDRENKLLLNKIQAIVKGRGTVNNWNQWSRKDLHAAARMKQQRQIELDNQAMLQRLQNTKPVIRRVQQKKDYEKHKSLKTMLEGSVKDYDTPRTRSLNSSGDVEDKKSVVTPRLTHPEEPDELQSPRSQEGSTGSHTNDNSKDDLPPLPAGQKAKTKRSKKPPPENRRKNRTAGVPKLPAIE